MSVPTHRSLLTLPCDLCYISGMTSINLRDIDEDLRDTFKAFCAAKGTTMRDELIHYMESKTEVERARVYGARLAAKQRKA